MARVEKARGEAAVASSGFGADLVVTESLGITLAGAAVALGSVHSLAPDHWMPFAVVARARNWSAPRTIRATVLCGLGHVTASVLLGLVGLAAGIELLEAFGRRLESAAGLLLMLFGIGYAAWGLRRTAGRKLHGHAHGRYDHVHDPSTKTEWALFLLFSADPCIAVIPILFAAAPLGAARTAGIVAAYETATVATMVGLVLPARAGFRVLRAHWLDHYGDAVAGCVIAAVGIAVTALGW